MYTVNDTPDCCPFGHQLGPGRCSLSYDTEHRAHWLLCGGCDRKTRILLDGRTTQWETYLVARRAWIPVE